MPGPRDYTTPSIRPTHAGATDDGPIGSLVVTYADGRTEDITIGMLRNEPERVAALLNRYANELLQAYIDETMKKHDQKST